MTKIKKVKKNVFYSYGCKFRQGDVQPSTTDLALPATAARAWNSFPAATAHETRQLSATVSARDFFRQSFCDWCETAAEFHELLTDWLRSVQQRVSFNLCKSFKFCVAVFRVSIGVRLLVRSLQAAVSVEMWSVSQHNVGKLTTRRHRINYYLWLTARRKSGSWTLFIAASLRRNGNAAWAANKK